MATPRIQVAPALVVEGRRLYENTMMPISDIAAMMGLKRRTLENRIVEWNWKRRRQPSGAIDLFHAVRGAAASAMTAEPLLANAVSSEPVSPQRRAALASGILSAVEHELAAVKRVLDTLATADKDKAEAERSARTLASIARTLREIAAIYQPIEATPRDEADNDPIPRDIDEFREELARRIHAIVDARRNRQSGGSSGIVERLETGRGRDL